MRPGERQRQLDELLAAFRDLWHPQPFRDIRPAWCDRWPALAAEVLALPDTLAEQLNNDSTAALELVARHVPEVADLAPLVAVAPRGNPPLPDYGSRWAWEIPGRKREQIEAFAAAARASGQPVLDWCGGKGHLGRLLALHWQTGATSLEIDAALCAEGRALAGRAGVAHAFIAADALRSGGAVRRDQHVVALHACGELHRSLIGHAAAARSVAIDVAPCCYYRGVAEHYQPLTAGLRLQLSRDDTRLAVTETVTASPRLARKRDKEMAWKLAFDAWRRDVTGDPAYRPFKPVPPAWFAGSFADFLSAMARRQELPPPSPVAAGECEWRGWQRQRDFLRLSIVRHAFRRALEIWLVLDLAGHLEEAGYGVQLNEFCPRRITPRNLLLSARY